MQVQTFERGDPELVPTEEELCAVTYNIGFGAYVPEYSFFMDGGKYSRALSMQEAVNAVNGSMELVKTFKPDFVLVQEVDIKADRSYNVNQLHLVERKFEDFQTLEAINYDSPYLFYPFTSPIGKSKSSIVTSSRYPIQEFTRRSLPMPLDLTKFLDLDRCYSVSKIEVENEKFLYVYNAHLIAYGGNDDIANAQVRMLLDDMRIRVNNGDYVICGADFNHDLTQDSYARFNGEGLVLPGWAQPFPIDLIGEGLVLLKDTREDGVLVPTSRNADKPYTGPADATLVIIDGFIVSENVTVVSVENVDAQFKFSDHNPVVLRFILE
jgi:endonuclease/exonuclease/phosphatase family metal-dependent hydrolase